MGPVTQYNAAVPESSLARNRPVILSHEPKIVSNCAYKLLATILIVLLVGAMAFSETINRNIDRLLHYTQNTQDWNFSPEKSPDILTSDYKLDLDLAKTELDKDNLRW